MDRPDLKMVKLSPHRDDQALGSRIKTMPGRITWC